MDPLLAGFLLFVIILFVLWCLLKFTYMGDEARDIASRDTTNIAQECAENFDLWDKYVNNAVDPDDPKNLTWSQHRDLSVEEKLEIIIEKFQPKR